MNKRKENRKNSRRSSGKSGRMDAAPIRNYKDTVWRMLYKDKARLLGLYNAMNRTDYTDEKDLIIVTLENAIYLGYKNDLAFVISDFLNLYEHQSTYNPNMPLRMLFYVASEYESLVRNRSLYSSVLQKIPTPRFVVFYNGQDRNVEKEVMKLSDAYANRTEDPELELKVTLYNINIGYNQELLDQCRTLSEYAAYVARVRTYVGQSSIHQAVNRAVDECIAEGILTDFLMKNRAEVVRMSIFEYDKEREDEKLRREAQEEREKLRREAQEEREKLRREMRREAKEELEELRKEMQRESQANLEKLRIEMQRESQANLEKLQIEMQQESQANLEKLQIEMQQESQANLEKLQIEMQQESQADLEKLQIKMQRESQADLEKLREEEQERGIKSLIESCRELNASESVTKAKLTQKYGMTDQEADALIGKYF